MMLIFKKIKINFPPQLRPSEIFINLFNYHKEISISMNKIIKQEVKLKKIANNIHYLFSRRKRRIS